MVACEAKAWYASQAPWPKCPYTGVFTKSSPGGAEATSTRAKTLPVEGEPPVLVTAAAAVGVTNPAAAVDDVVCVSEDLQA